MSNLPTKYNSLNWEGPGDKAILSRMVQLKICALTVTVPLVSSDFRDLLPVLNPIIAIFYRKVAIDNIMQDPHSITILTSVSTKHP